MNNLVLEVKNRVIETFVQSAVIFIQGVKGFFISFTYFGFIYLAINLLYEGVGKCKYSLGIYKNNMNI